MLIDLAFSIRPSKRRLNLTSGPESGTRKTGQVEEVFRRNLQLRTELMSFSFLSSMHCRHSLEKKFSNVIVTYTTKHPLPPCSVLFTSMLLLSGDDLVVCILDK